MKIVKWLGNLEVETNCECKKPDWVTNLGTDEMTKKNQYYLQCDNCKEYAYRNGSQVVVELVKEIKGGISGKLLLHYHDLPRWD